jgi:hypothetical protein
LRFGGIRHASTAWRLIFGWLIFEIDIGEPLAVVIAHDKAGVQFLDRPGRRSPDGARNANAELVFVNGRKVIAST